MIASIEWCDCKGTGLLRVHAEGYGEGGPWTFGCVVRDYGEHVAYLALALRCPSVTEARALRQVLMDAGFSEVRWERRNVRRARVTSFSIKALA